MTRPDVTAEFVDKAIAGAIKVAIQSCLDRVEKLRGVHENLTPGLDVAVMAINGLADELRQSRIKAGYMETES